MVSIEFSPLSSVELTNSWYQLHNGDYTGILEHSFGKQLPANVLQLLLDFYKLICPVRILKLVCPVRTDLTRVRVLMLRKAGFLLPHTLVKERFDNGLYH